MERLYVKQMMIKPIDERTYLLNLPVVKWLLKSGKLDFTSNVTFFVGENGTGKSTIIEALAICAGFNAEGGSKNFNFSTKQTSSELYKYITLSKSAHEKDGFFLRAESFYNVASQVDDLGLDLGGYGGQSLHNQSHGESFMALVQNRFRGNGLYILDEPEAALSPSTALALSRSSSQIGIEQCAKCSLGGNAELWCQHWRAWLTWKMEVVRRANTIANPLPALVIPKFYLTRLNFGC
jgi:predicted ATPase